METRVISVPVVVYFSHQCSTYARRRVRIVQLAVVLVTQLLEFCGTDACSCSTKYSTNCEYEPSEIRQFVHSFN